MRDGCLHSSPPGQNAGTAGWQVQERPEGKHVRTHTHRTDHPSSIIYSLHIDLANSRIFHMKFASRDIWRGIQCDKARPLVTIHPSARVPGDNGPPMDA